MHFARGVAAALLGNQTQERKAAEGGYDFWLGDMDAAQAAEAHSIL